MTADEWQEAPHVVWPENWRAWGFFLDYCGTQWRWASAGMGAPIRTGLDYTAIKACIDAQTDLTEEQRKELFDDVRQMERAALAGMNNQPPEEPFDQPFDDPDEDA